MNKPLISTSLFASSLAATLLLASAPAQAQHDVRVFLADSGVSFLEDQVPSYVPSVLEPPTFGKSFACMDFEQRDTTINLSIDKVDIDMPDDDRIRVALEFSGTADGELYADDIYACFGEVTCQDTMNVDRAKALLDFDVEIVGGQPRVQAREISLDVRPDDFEFNLNDCGFTGSLLTTAIGFAEGWILNYIEGKVAAVAEENLAPMLENMLRGMSMDAAYVKASVQDMYFPNDGVSLTLDVGLRTNEGGVACVRDYDRGAPAREGGESAPDLLAGNSDVNLAANFGLLNQGLYTAWQQGLLCIDNEVLYALGLDVDLNVVGTLLPGFPPGTEFALEVVFTDHPKVTGMTSDGAGLVADIAGIEIDLHGDRPDGTRNTLHVEVDLQAQAELLVNPADNAINARLRGAEIKRMLMKDEREATGEGYDVARIKQLVHDRIVPHVLGELAPIPLTGSVFAVSDYAVLLRSLDANKAYLSAGIDLFRVPENDTSAPETQIVGAPTGVTNPHDALIQLGGSDEEIPSELLQYLVTVDGVERPLSFVKDLHVGESGKTGTYEVSVVAVDLAGNVDPTPATASVVVDGLVPFVVVNGPRTRSADEGPVTVKWTMRDDRTWDEELGVRVEVYELQDPTDALSTRLVETQELAAGATETVIDLVGDGGVYRVEVHVTDEAGNDSQSSLLLSLASTGGCSVGGQGQGGAFLLLMALGFLSLRRRRR
jgi:MYXO-CTERM domain-containing protein